MKFHSIIAFCGISTLAVVYYCYYQYITCARKRKQTSANRFLASIKQENNTTSDHISTTNCNSNSDKFNKSASYNTLPNPTPDIITDHLASLSSRESKEETNYDLEEVDGDLIEENSVIVKEVERVCSAAVLVQDNKICTGGANQATACRLDLKVNTDSTVVPITQRFGDGTGQCTVESTSTAFCELENKNLSLFIGTIKDSKDSSQEQEPSLKQIIETESNCIANMCDEVIANPQKTDKTEKEADLQVKAQITSTSTHLTSTESTRMENESGDMESDLSNGYISWASIVEESLKEQSDTLLNSDIQTNTPYVLNTSDAAIAHPSNHSKISPSKTCSGSTNNQDSSYSYRNGHATDSKANPKKLNKGINNYQKTVNTATQMGHRLTSDGTKMPQGAKNNHQFSNSHYHKPSADPCNKQSPSSVSANDKNRHSPNNSSSTSLAKNQNLTSPSKNNYSIKHNQHEKQANSPNSNQKTNSRQTTNHNQYGNESNNKNVTSLNNSALSVDCNEANTSNTKQNCSTNTKTTGTYKPADSRSNQENDPSRKSLRAKVDKKMGGEKKEQAAKNAQNGECLKQNGHSSLDQIYLNDSSVISVISPSNYSEADSAVISCGESSLASITYLPNGIPSPSGTSTDSGMRRSSGSPEYFNPSLEEYLSWEVEIPTPVGGKIIGKAGRNVKELRDKTGCKVIIKDIENSRRRQLLVVRGTLEQIQTCHRLLDKKFRKEIEFENGVYYTMEGLAGFLGYPMPPAITAPAQIMPAANTYLQLPQCAYFDAIVCNIQTAGHFFLQQPTHNSFYNLDRLHDCMRDCYRNPAVPELPSPITLGTISAAFLDGRWCRSQVVGVSVDENVVTVRFLDVGGYREMPRHNVKQIRTDFLSLPFQATEVFLSEVTPSSDEADFNAEATKFLEELLAESGTPQALVKGWNMSDMPLVDLIVRKDGKFESLGDLLIRNGYAVALNVGVKCS